MFLASDTNDILHLLAERRQADPRWLKHLRRYAAHPGGFSQFLAHSPR
jgi:hypothetical protein